MTADDWNQAQRAEPVLSLLNAKMQDGTLGQSPHKPTDPPELCMFLQEYNHLKLRQVILYRRLLPKDSKEAQFQLVLPAMHWETVLRGYPDEVSHLGLKCMLDLMCNHFFNLGWLNGSKTKEHIERCCQHIIFMSKQEWAPMEILWQPMPWSWCTLTTCAWSWGMVRTKMSC